MSLIRKIARQLGARGGRARAKSTTKAQRQEWGRRGGKARARKAKRRKLIRAREKQALTAA